MLLDLDNLRRHAKKKLTPRRFRHSLEVRKEAVRLARRWGADWYKAGIAGLLHDICKDMDRDDLLNYIRSCGILMDILTLESPPVWHGLAGFHYVRDVLDIQDMDIRNAIQYHTTARRDMSPLEKVVFVADLTSADRSYPDIAVMREWADKDLDGAVFYGVRHAIRKLVKKDRPIVEDTWRAYNGYREAYVSTADAEEGTEDL